MISPKHKAIFVHIPKVAGQSIETVFLEDLALKWANRSELLLREKTPDEKGPHRLAHLKAKDYVTLGYVDPKTYHDYFTFTFVRDPYARVLSLYHYLGYSRIISVSVFIERVLVRKVAEGHFFFQPQYEYVYSDTGALLVDFVGKLERISEDIQVVLKRCGMEGRSLPHVNKSEKGLKRGLAAIAKNPSLLRHLKIQNIFSNKKVAKLTPEERSRIQKLYPDDFECFHYEK